MTLEYRHTRYACYLSTTGHAIINNLPSLLFLTFQRSFGISLEKIGLLVSIKCGGQMLTEDMAAKYVDRVGYRPSIVFAQLLCVTGMICLGVLPFLLPNPYVGLVIATVISAIGGGLNEVLLSPIVETLPGDEKAAAMSMLHSFYCWGHMAVVILSTVFFLSVGLAHWPILLALWTLVPISAGLLFLKVPMCGFGQAEGKQASLRKLFSNQIFWVLFILMISSGASEQAMSQWSSLFAEAGLGVSKTMGDMLGPCAFALMMGLSRVFFATHGSGIKLENALMASGGLCIVSYLMTVFSPWPVVSLLGCALCGFGVGLMWPGALSLSAATYPQGGTAMFAMLALGGDIGCAVGPGLVGLISSAVERVGDLPQAFAGMDKVQLGLKAGILLSLAFPVIVCLCIGWARRRRNQKLA